MTMMMMTGHWLSCSHWFNTLLGFAFFLLKCSSPYLPGTVSPDCLGNSPLPSCDESGQGLEQLNRRDKQSLIQTAMQNMQADASENVLSGILDFKLHPIKLKWGRTGVWWSWTCSSQVVTVAVRFPQVHKQSQKQNKPAKRHLPNTKI